MNFIIQFILHIVLWNQYKQENGRAEVKMKVVRTRYTETCKRTTNQKQEDILMKQNFINGIVMMSENGTIVGTIIADDIRYIGVVAEKNEFIPHIVVMLDKPVEELSDEEEESVYDFCAGVCPEITSIRERQVDPLFENGTIVNAEEWEQSPHLGLFNDPEVEEKVLELLAIVAEV